MHGESALPIILINGYQDVDTPAAAADELANHIPNWDVERLLGLGYREDGVQVAQSPDSFNTCYVFTDVVANDFDGHIIMERYEEMARNRGCPLIVINLVCRPEESRDMPPMWRGPNGLFWTEINVSTDSSTGSAVSTARMIAGHAIIEAFAFWHCS